MKKIKVFSTVLLMCVLMLSMGIMVFGYDDSENFFAGQKVNQNTYLE